ncbi:YkgJ family cysteine cluster protein [Beggiatoa alba]|nr:YkgJ family cysteine cluster protein [Beggiatoa alba]
MAKQGEFKITITAENKCSFCEGTKCCAYTTQEIDTPRTKNDFDHLLWQIAHMGIQVYKDAGRWFLLVNNPCQFLENDGRCGIYETRPQLCRDYSNDYCEFDEPAEKGFKFYFKTYHELLAYCQKRFSKWDERFTDK